MAPRPGGEGSGSIGTNAGHARNKCTLSNTIGSKTVVARLVIDGIALALLLGISGLWFVAKRKNPNLRRLLPWYYFGLLLITDSIYIALDITATVLTNCFVLDIVDYSRVNVVVSVLSEFSNILALGIILLPLTLHILHRAGQKARIVTIVNSVTFGAVVLMVFPFLVINNMSNVDAYSSGPSFPSVATKIGATYYLLFFAASLIGSVILFFALIKAAGDIAITKPIKIWAIFTTTFLLLGSISVVIEMFGWALPEKTLTESAWITFVALFQFFFILTIFGILQTGASAAMSFTDPTRSATYDPYAPHELEPGIHKRFTYTGGSEESQHSPRQYETQWASANSRTQSDHAQPISPHAL